MIILDSLLTIEKRTTREARTSREALMNIMSGYQACFDSFHELQAYINADNVEFDKELHLMGTLSGRNSIKGFTLQIIIDKKSREMVDARFIDHKGDVYT